MWPKAGASCVGVLPCAQPPTTPSPSPDFLLLSSITATPEEGLFEGVGTPELSPLKKLKFLKVLQATEGLQGLLPLGPAASESHPDPNPGAFSQGSTRIQRMLTAAGQGGPGFESQLCLRALEHPVPRFMVCKEALPPGAALREKISMETLHHTQREPQKPEFFPSKGPGASVLLSFHCTPRCSP